MVKNLQHTHSRYVCGFLLLKLISEGLNLPASLLHLVENVMSTGMTCFDQFVRVCSGSLESL